MTLRDATSWRRRRLLMPAALVTVVLLPGLARPAVASLFGFDDLTIVSKRLHKGLLAAKYPPETVAVYLHAFNDMNEANWTNLKAILDADKRLQLGATGTEKTG